MDKTSPSDNPAVYGTTLWSNKPGGTIRASKRLQCETRTRNSALRALQGDQNVVYALRLTDGTIKIGCTSDLAQRRRSYPGSEVLGFRIGDFTDERFIHDDLVPYRARGREYYHPTPEVIAVVNDMRAVFDLPPLAA